MTTTHWWTCSSCHAMNDKRASLCASCGVAKVTTTTTLARETDPIGCAWSTDGRLCLMAGVFAMTMGTPERPSRWLCEWHSAAGLTHADRANFDEFDRWVLAWLEAGYCMQFTHRRASELWAAVRGESRPSAATSRACTQPSCPHREEFSAERLPVSTEEAKEHLAMLQRVLARTPLALPHRGTITEVFHV